MALDCVTKTICCYVIMSFKSDTKRYVFLYSVFKDGATWGHVALVLFLKTYCYK